MVFAYTMPWQMMAWEKTGRGGGALSVWTTVFVGMVSGSWSLFGLKILSLGSSKVGVESVGSVSKVRRDKMFVKLHYLTNATI